MLQDNNNTNVIAFIRRNEKKNEKLHPPMLNIPPLTKFFLGLIVTVQIFVSAAGLISPAAESSIYLHGGFVPANWNGELPFLWWTPFTLLSFSFLHGGWIHLAVNALSLLAFGSGCERSLGWKRMLIVFAVSTVSAIITHSIFYPQGMIIGMSGGLSGFFAAMLYLLYKQTRLNGQRPTSLIAAAGLFIIISIIFGMMGSPEGGQIAWVAHIGGFFGGLAVIWLMMRKRAAPSNF